MNEFKYPHGQISIMNTVINEEIFAYLQKAIHMSSYMYSFFCVSTESVCFRDTDGQSRLRRGRKEEGSGEQIDKF